MPLPIPVVAGIIAISKFIAKKGVQAAIKKYGKKAVTNAQKKTPKKTTNKDSLESTLGRKRTGPSPKPSDSKAFRDAAKIQKRKADEKLDPSLKNTNLPRASINSRILDVKQQLRELAKSKNPDFKAIDRLQNRLSNLKDMITDRPDLTNIGGKFDKGGSVTKKKTSAVHVDYRKKGLFS
tara:strand:+ start:81 stop:620 length:540 start_codon:yes stop_codon:yes gene_type:complete